MQLFCPCLDHRHFLVQVYSLDLGPMLNLPLSLHFWPKSMVHALCSPFSLDETLRCNLPLLNYIWMFTALRLF